MSVLLLKKPDLKVIQICSILTSHVSRDSETCKQDVCIWQKNMTHDKGGQDSRSDITFWCWDAKQHTAFQKHDWKCCNISWNFFEAQFCLTLQSFHAKIMLNKKSLHFIFYQCVWLIVLMHNCDNPCIRTNLQIEKYFELSRQEGMTPDGDIWQQSFTETLPLHPVFHLFSFKHGSHCTYCKYFALSKSSAYSMSKQHLAKDSEKPQAPNEPNNSQRQLDNVSKWLG